MLSIQHIVKKYGDQFALNDVSMEIEKGSIFGLLGPNGAGKTSLIRIINQITAPDLGSVYFNGEKLERHHAEKIGYLPEERGLYKKMEVGEQIIYFARLKGLSRLDAIKKTKYWLERYDMISWWKKTIDELSKGMAQKVQFITTLIHDPELLILDEPFSGFDPVNADLVKNEIIDFYKSGRSVIFSTHRLENIETFCTHIALINKSKKILDAPTQTLIDAYKDQTYKIEFRGDGQIFQSLSPNVQLLSLQSGESTHTAVVKILNGQPNDLLASILAMVQIVSFGEVIPTVNEIFLKEVAKPSHE